ncbi:unnamed protein product, partial [Rangifer tarandus platyrhynchus]
SSNSHQTLTVELPAHSFSTCNSQNSHVTFQLPRPSVAPNSLVSLKRTFCLCNMHQNIMLIPSELGFPAGSTGDLLNPGIKLLSPVSSALHADLLPLSHRFTQDLSHICLFS